MFPAFYVLGLWLLDFTSQFAPDSPVRAPLFLICFVVTVKGREGQPEGYGTVTDMPHPSVHRSGNNNKRHAKKCLYGRHAWLKPVLIMMMGQLLHLNTALNLQEVWKTLQQKTSLENEIMSTYSSTVEVDFKAFYIFHSIRIKWYSHCDK